MVAKSRDTGRSCSGVARPVVSASFETVVAPVRVADTVLDEISDEIAAFPPERGGALICAGGVITELLYDRWADTGDVWYRPSLRVDGGDDSLEAAVQIVELAGGGRFAGYVHSHPGGIDRPSSQDLVAFADTFGLNPTLGSLEVPIVTRFDGGRLDVHERGVGAGKLSWFTVTELDGRLVCARRPVVVCSFGTDLAVAAALLDARVEPPTWRPVVVGRSVVLEAQLTLPMGPTVSVRIDPVHYPKRAPRCALVNGGDRRGPVRAAWEPGQPGARGELIAAAVRKLVGTGGAAPLPVNRPTTTPVRSHEEVAAGLRARLDGIVPPSIRSARVAVFGLGSGGSRIAEVLARSGVESFVLVDPDTVAVENLSRSVYVFGDVGQTKTDALGRYLQAINPAVQVETYPASVQGLTIEQLKALCADAALVVGATDDPRAQALINFCAYPAGVPAVYGGVYELGRAGEIVFAVPGLTPCYRCATAIRHQGSHRLLGGHDYGLRPGRLTGAPALGADIHHVATAAAKIGLALLALDDIDSPLVREFLLPSISRPGRWPANLVQLSTVPGYDYFGELFKGVVAQGAWQTVWLTVLPDPACQICGADDDESAAVAPASASSRTVGSPESKPSKPLPCPADPVAAPTDGIKQR